jgi:hypothetical protein
VPVCLKCGKEIEPGNDYCRECAAADEQQVERIMAITTRVASSRPRRVDNRWIILSMFAFAVALLVIAAAVVFSIPRGKKFAEAAQAAICRSNLRQVQEAISLYNTTNGTFPPTGRVNARHPLVVDQYLKTPPRCPTTHRYYIIEKDGTRYRAICDSGLAGHSI